MKSRLYPVILMLTMLMLFSACTPIARIFFGIKKPKVENEESLMKFMKKKDFDASNVVTIDFDNFMEAYKMINKSMPDVLIFDKSGAYIPYGEEWACNAGAFNFIEELRADSSYASREGKRIDAAMEGLCDLKGNPIMLPSGGQDDFTIFIYWTAYSGKLNKDHVLVWEQQAKNNKQAKIKIVKVNMDIQEHWGEETLRKINNKKKK